MALLAPDRLNGALTVTFARLPESCGFNRMARKSRVADVMAHAMGFHDCQEARLG